MKRITWNSGKNTKLKIERGVSFELVMESIARGVYRIDMTTSRSHGRQKAFFVRLNGKDWLVPFDEGPFEIILRKIMEET
jgi:hypothetical protein